MRACLFMQPADTVYTCTCVCVYKSASQHKDFDHNSYLAMYAYVIGITLLKLLITKGPVTG